MYVLGKELNAWSRSGEKALLDEAELGAEALYEIIKELKKR